MAKTLDELIGRLEVARRKYGGKTPVLVYEDEMGPEGYVLTNVVMCNENKAVLLRADGNFESGPGAPVKIEQMSGIGA